ncbi:nicotinate-nucleotide adenylyltransferase [Aeromonas cavernicola]|uniref:Probable nicotinate-nucleotide adenylyltransferase n=1 Tax=Aeromonas cavernicola TaxID=1006623 RepID=A0A2H9U590_9GAMM|nr:nicotinate-nucleotide adenylyltransferase [Aeromonas cavernicola]PJG59191.1 nicotinic acid mononucleotide adenylyltransferase [Aeromonas cavernicola]
MLTAPIGLLGGTFDPIHIGHLRPAIEVRDAIGLAEVRLIPNHIPPHRANPFCSSEQRLAMVRLAAAENRHFVVDERELLRDKPSYTIDTLVELRQELPETPLCFLMGMDSLLGLPSWHRWQELLGYAHLVVSVRPGWQPDYPAEVAQLLARHHTTDASALHRCLAGHVWLADNQPIDLSATRLRALLDAGQDARYLLPESVAHYIDQQGLYRTMCR